MNTHWTAERMASQEGKIVIITGANSGIGFHATKELAGKGAQIIMAIRNKDKGFKALQEIQNQFPDANLKVMTLDLGNLESVSAFAEAFKKEYTHLDILLNNAGVMMPPYSKTDDGFELQFGVNHLGHFALTAQLFDILKSTPHSRIVNVSSLAHKQGKINFDDLQWEKSYRKMKAYAQSKLSNLLFTYELARSTEAAGLSVKAVAAHPGVSQTNLMRYLGIFKGIMRLMTQPAWQGALPLLYAATDQGVSNADYIGPDGRREIKGYPVKVKSRANANDVVLAEKLWSESEALIGQKFRI